MSDLNLSHVLGVGGGEGALGREICAHLALCGATVVSADVAPAPDPPGASGAEIAHLHADLGVPKQVAHVLDVLESRHAHQAATVCCYVGLVGSYRVLDYRLEDCGKPLRVNRGAFVFAQVAAKAWRAGGARGHLAFASSWVQHRPWPEHRSLQHQQCTRVHA